MPYKVNIYKACELKPTEVELFINDLVAIVEFWLTIKVLKWLFY